MKAPSARPLKRSVRIAGHATSVTLEAAFWDALQRLARREGKSLNAIVSEIDAGSEGNLSSAIRVHLLNDALRRASTIE